MEENATTNPPTNPPTPTDPTSTAVPTENIPTPTPSPESVTTSTPAPEPSASTPSTPSSSAPPTSPPTTSQEHQQHRMSLRTILLIVVLAILAGVLLFVALSQTKTHKVATKIVPTPTLSPAHSILTMALETSSTTSAIPLASKMVDVNITTSSNKVDGVQFEIAYDPTVLANVTVRPGTFFPNPLTLLNSVDSKNGKINFAVGIQPTAQAVTGQGTVAVISYTLLPTAVSSVTTLKFLPKTQVVGQGILGSVLEKAINLTIPVTGLTPAPTTKNATSAAQ